MNPNNETMLHVTGMTCANCVRHVTEALSAVPGVTAVEVGLEEGRVLVRHDPAHAVLEEFQRVLDEEGYATQAWPV